MTKSAYAIQFVILVFIAISCLVTVILSLLNPSLTIEFILWHPIFSSLRLIHGLLLHIFGNLFFAAVAIFYALKAWRKYNE